MAGSMLGVSLVILLGLSHLVSLNAVPATRTRSLLSTPQEVTPMEINNHQEITDENWEEAFFINGRMELEKMDYPGSGANNRHTPHPSAVEKQS